MLHIFFNDQQLQLPSRCLFSNTFCYILYSLLHFLIHFLIRFVTFGIICNNLLILVGQCNKVCNDVVKVETWGNPDSDRWIMKSCWLSSQNISKSRQVPPPLSPKKCQKSKEKSKEKVKENQHFQENWKKLEKVILLTSPKILNEIPKN